MRDVGTLTARNWAEGAVVVCQAPGGGRRQRGFAAMGVRAACKQSLGGRAPSLLSSRLCGHHPFPRTDLGRGPGLSGARRRLELK